MNKVEAIKQLDIWINNQSFGKNNSMRNGIPNSIDWAYRKILSVKDDFISNNYLENLKNELSHLHTCSYM